MNYKAIAEKHGIKGEYIPSEDVSLVDHSFDVNEKISIQIPANGNYGFGVTQEINEEEFLCTEHKTFELALLKVKEILSEIEG